MKPLSILLVFSFFGSAVNAQHTLTFGDKNFIYNLLVDSVLSVDSVNYHCVVKSITIIHKADNKIIQKILPEENYPSCGLSKEEVFIIEDINFDGFNDIRLLQFLPAGPNLPYYYWVYDQKMGKFSRNKSLEEIKSPTFDPAKKLIYSFWRASCCDHGLSTYKYVKGIPLLIEEAETAMDTNDTTKYIVTLKKRINGNMKLVSRKIEKETKSAQLHAR